MSKYITIDGFESLTKQQMFDISAKHILSTGRASFCEKRGMCTYSGSGCAAAPFIREDKREFADGNVANAGTGWYSLTCRESVPTHERDFVGHLQQAHDDANVHQKEHDADFMDTWKQNMRELAKGFYLNASVLDS